MKLLSLRGLQLACGLLGLALSMSAQASQATWRGVEVRQLAQSPKDPETIYAIGNSFFYRSDDRGRHWKPLRAPKAIEYADLHVDPDDARHVLILARSPNTAEKPSLHESFDRGHTWTSRESIRYSNEDGTEGGSFFPNRLFVPKQQGVGDWLAYDGRHFQSSDGGRNWIQTQAGPMDITVVPGRPARFGLKDNVVWRSSDAGQTWDKAHIFDSELKDARRARAPSNLLALSEDELVVRDPTGNWLQSNDRGDHWAPATNGFQHLNRLSPSADNKSLARPFDNTGCDVNRSPAPGVSATLVARCVEGGDGGKSTSTCFHRSKDAGRTWMPPRNAGSRSNATCQQDGLRRDWQPVALSLDVADPQTMLVAWMAGGMFRSEDGGQSWQASDTGLMFRSIHGSDTDWIALGEPGLIQAVLYRDRELLQRSLAEGADINMEGNALGGVLEADIVAHRNESKDPEQPGHPPMWFELRKAGANSVVSRASHQTFLSLAMTLASKEIVDDLIGLGYDWGKPRSGSGSVQPDWLESELNDLLQNQAEHLGLTSSRTRELISTYIRAGYFPSADQTTLDLLKNGYADLAVDVIKASTRVKPFDRQGTARRASDLSITTALLLARQSDEAKTIFATIPLSGIRAPSTEKSDFHDALGAGCDLKEARWYKARGVPLKLAQHFQHCLSDVEYPAFSRHRMLRAMQDDLGIPPESWNLWLDDNDKRWVRKTDLYKAAVRAEEKRGTGVIGIKLDWKTESEYFNITEIIEGLPAAAQGLRVGDEITAVNGHTTYLLSFGQVLASIAGHPGTWVRLDVLRNGSPLSFRIQRQIRPTEFSLTSVAKDPRY